MTNRHSFSSRLLCGLPAAILIAVLGLSGCGGDGGESGQGDALTGVSQGADTTAPSVPEDVSAEAVSSAQIDIAWSASTDNREVTGYRLLRNGSEVAMLDGVTEFEDTGLNAATEYAYTVEAMDAAGNGSGPSAVTIATTSALDATPPTVSAVSIEDAATPLAVNSEITVDFSAAMAKSTINPKSFKVETRGGRAVPGEVSVRGATATFTPSSELSADTEHTATVTTEATDTAGNAMAENFATTFATTAVADTTRPRVSATLPANSALNVARNSSVSAVFSEAMRNSTLTTSSFTLKRTSTGTSVGGTVKVTGSTATFKPLALLAGSTQYTATITTAAKDAAGNALAANFTWKFTTSASADTTAPVILSRDPSSSETGVALNTSIRVTFSEPMTSSTLTTGTFKLSNTSTGAAVAGTVVYSSASNTVSFTPSKNLVAGTKYSAAILNSVKDAAGNSMASSFGWNFTTAGTIDSTRPAVSSTSPQNSATGVATSAAVSATFSEPMRNSTLTTASVTLVKTSGGTAVTGTVSVTGNSVKFTPSAALAGSTQYTATITTAAKDAAGNALAANHVWRFTTAAATTNTTVGLDWDSSAASPLGGYRIYYGTSSRKYLQGAGQGLNVGKVTAYTISGLSRGTRYYFSVTAFDTSNNESEYSNEVFKDIP